MRPAQRHASAPPPGPAAAAAAAVRPRACLGTSGIHRVQCERSTRCACCSACCGVPSVAFSTDACCARCPDALPVWLCLLCCGTGASFIAAGLLAAVCTRYCAPHLFA